MAAKRQATSKLNHENWDQEEEPEERGTFRKASENELKNRVIKKARRKVAGSSGKEDNDDGAPKSVFSGFAGFGKATSTAPSSSPFSFISKIPAPTDSNSSVTAKRAATFSFGSAGTSPIVSGIKNDISTDNEKSVLTENTVKLKKTENYQAKVTSLNIAVTEWIKTHVDKNPLCILTPIFKDYEKYINDIEEEEKKLENNVAETDNELFPSSADKFKLSSSPAKPSTDTISGSTTFSFDAKPAAAVPTTSSILTKPSTETTKSNLFSFGLKPTENESTEKETETSPARKGFIFGLKSDEKTAANTPKPFTFGIPTSKNGESAEKKPETFSFTAGSTPFSFGNIKPPAASATLTSDGPNGADDEEDQPPKVEFKQVVEEDAMYSKKCKVFVKKDGAFVDRGVGTLYLKSVKDSEKTQLLVRADTNLGNILVNLILSAGIPTQRMGKNNVMMVCLPTPDVEKATSMLLRVKTGEEADELLAELEKHKK